MNELNLGGGIVKHGHARRGHEVTEYRVWASMKQRCGNPNNIRYNAYGGRGIRVCDRWAESFENFISDMGYRPSSDHTIDRINVNGNYEAGNCRWVTKHDQYRNTTRNVCVVVDGSRMILKDAAKKLNLNYRSIHSHISYHKMTPQEAFEFCKENQK